MKQPDAALGVVYIDPRCVKDPFSNNGSWSNGIGLHVLRNVAFFTRYPWTTTTNTTKRGSGK